MARPGRVGKAKTDLLGVIFLFERVKGYKVYCQNGKETRIVMMMGNDF
jgi:hypothetical protein